MRHTFDISQNNQVGGDVIREFATFVETLFLIDSNRHLALPLCGTSDFELSKIATRPQAIAEVTRAHFTNVVKSCQF